MTIRYPPQPSLPAVATILTRDERMRVDAAGQGLYRTVHRDNVDQVMTDLRGQQVGAVVVSVNRCGAGSRAALARVVREFPRVSTVALLSHVDADTPSVVLSLGGSGVRTLIDVRNPSGWRELRGLIMSDRAHEIERLALGSLEIDLASAPAGCLRFFALIFGRAERITTIRQLAAQLGLVTSTLMSRFFRNGLPAPKRYLSSARLVHAARLFENPGLSVANVANHLDYSSPQSFGRHVKMMTGYTATDFRQHYDGEGMFEWFRARLVTPYLEILRRFDPIDPRGWAGRRLGVLADGGNASPEVSPNRDELSSPQPLPSQPVRVRAVAE